MANQIYNVYDWSDEEEEAAQPPLQGPVSSLAAIPGNIRDCWTDPQSQVTYTCREGYGGCWGDDGRQVAPTLWNLAWGQWPPMALALDQKFPGWRGLLPSTQTTPGQPLQGPSANNNQQPRDGDIQLMPLAELPTQKPTQSPNPAEIIYSQLDLRKGYWAINLTK